MTENSVSLAGQKTKTTDLFSLSFLFLALHPDIFLKVLCFPEKACKVGRPCQDK